MRSYLYVIGPKSGPIKIGISAAPEAVRLRQLQTGHPKKLSVIAQKPGGIEEERAVHAFFQMWRVEGEWFKRSHEVKEFIALLSGGCSVPIALEKMAQYRAAWWEELRQAELAKAGGETRR